MPIVAGRAAGWALLSFCPSYDCRMSADADASGTCLRWGREAQERDLLECKPINLREFCRNVMPYKSKRSGYAWII